MLEQVWRASHSIPQTIGVVVLHHLSRALFEIGRGDNAEIRIQRQTRAHFFSRRRLHHDGVDRVAVAMNHVGNHNLAAPARSVFRNCGLDRLVASAIAAGCSQHAADIFSDRSDADGISQRTRQAHAVWRRVGFRHHQSEHAIGPERASRQGGHDAAVDTAGHTDDHAAAPQLMMNDFSNGMLELCGDRGRVDAEHGSRKHSGRSCHADAPSAAVTSARSVRRLILPVAVIGNASRISTTFGTMNGNAEYGAGTSALSPFAKRRTRLR